MGDGSGGHCGRHRAYRCDECETNHPDDYHGTGQMDGDSRRIKQEIDEPLNHEGKEGLSE